MIVFLWHHNDSCCFVLPPCFFVNLLPAVLPLFYYYYWILGLSFLTFLTGWWSKHMCLLCHNYVAFIILKEKLLCCNSNHSDDTVFNISMKVWDLSYLSETSALVCWQHLLRSEYCCFQECNFMQFCLRTHFCLIVECSSTSWVFML